MIKYFLFIFSLFFLGGEKLYSFPGKVRSSISAPNCCSTGIAYDGKLLWVSDHRDDAIYGLNPSDGKVEKKIPSPGYRPYGLAYDGKNLWCADTESEMLYKIDIDKSIVISTIPSTTGVPSGIAWDGNLLLVGNKKEGKIHKIDPQDGTVVSSINSPSKNISALFFGDGYIWVSDRINDEIYMVEPQTGFVAMIIPAPAPHVTGLTSIKNNLIGVDYQTDKIYFMPLKSKEYILKGEEKSLKVDFIYELRNHGPDAIFDAEVFIAIPHDYENQKILEQPLFKPDVTKFLKEDSEKIAYFKFDKIENGEIKKIVMTLKVQLQNIRYMVFPEDIKEGEIPKEIKEKYLNDGTKYSINDPLIKKIAKEVIKDEKNLYWKARKLYEFVIDELSYEMAGGWNPAPMILKNKTGSCSEYSFLLISLLRTSGIPARYVGSIVVRGDDASWDDAYHRWVEIYLPPYGWFPADANKGDKEFPYLHAKGFGEVDNRVLITTWSGGNSQFLDWNYNVHFRYKCNGKCLVKSEGIAEWQPLKRQGG